MGHGPGMHGCVDTRLGVDTKTFMRTPHSHTEYQLDMWQITLAFPAFFGEEVGMPLADGLEVVPLSPPIFRGASIREFFLAPHTGELELRLQHAPRLSRS